MLRITLRRAYRRTVRSLLVKPPSLNTGWVNRFVVTIGTFRPVSASAALNVSIRLDRSASLDPNGIRSSSWKVSPYAPISASLCTASIGSSGARVASPNGSRACQPTVHSPKVNLSVVVSVMASLRRDERPCPGRAARVFVQSLNIRQVGPPLSTLRAPGPPRGRLFIQNLNEYARPMTIRRSAPARQPSLREHNLALVLGEVAATGAVSRARIAASTGLTKATVSTLVDALVAAGLLR